MTPAQVLHMLPPSEPKGPATAETQTVGTPADLLSFAAMTRV